MQSVYACCWRTALDYQPMRSSICALEPDKSCCALHLGFRCEMSLELTPNIAMLASSCLAWLSRESRRNRLTVFASASSSGHLECCKPRSIRRLGGSPRFRPRQMMELFASESFRAKCRTRTRGFSAEWRDMLEFFQQQKTLQCSRTLCLGEEPRLYGLRLWRYSLGENSRLPERRVPWAGIPRPHRPSRANTFRHHHSDIWVIPAPHYGLIQNANYQSRC